MFFFKGNGFEFPLNTRTYIMGILNITPNSFFDGGKYNTAEAAVSRCEQMQTQGADIIDIGANSTNPKAEILTENEELEIIKAFLPLIVKKCLKPVSVDTFYPSVAKFALENGVNIINDVSGKFNPDMAKLIKDYNAGYIVMHNPAFSSSEIADYSQQGGVVNSVNSFFDEMQTRLCDYGVKAESICCDMGIGFSKSHKDNVELIKNIKALKKENRALLCALSCKRVTGIPTSAEGEDRLYPTIAADTLAIAGGADFIRVHHVKEAVLSAKMADEIVR